MAMDNAFAFEIGIHQSTSSSSSSSSLHFSMSFTNHQPVQQQPASVFALLINKQRQICIYVHIFVVSVLNSQLLPILFGCQSLFATSNLIFRIHHCNRSVLNIGNFRIISVKEQYFLMLQKIKFSSKVRFWYCRYWQTRFRHSIVFNTEISENLQKSPGSRGIW
jgi:hypothetical protein